jgi:large subunit ribosomal protein L18
MSRQSPQQKRDRVKRKIRALISGTAERPRLTVFRSNTALFAQLIDDEKAVTVASVRDSAKGKGSKVEKAIESGKTLAKLAKEKGVKACVFDRNGFKYAGRIKAFADAVREGGINF